MNHNVLCRMDLVEVRGKSTRGIRKVFILLTTEMVDAITYLIQHRRAVGVKDTNRYIFARENSDTPINGCEAMRACIDQCDGLSNPKSIRTRGLRKYMATTLQVYICISLSIYTK